MDAKREKALKNVAAAMTKEKGFKDVVAATTKEKGKAAEAAKMRAQFADWWQRKS